MNIIKQLELDLGPLTHNISQTTSETTTTSTEKPKKKENAERKESKEKWKNTACLFDETGRRILARRPRLEKDYQKELVFYLAKACEYLPWRFYVEFEVNFQGKLGFIDLVLKTERPQDWLVELKKGTVTVEIIQEILERNYLEAYKQRNKKSKYPLLYLIGQKVNKDVDEYIDLINDQLIKQCKRYKYKPKIYVRTYTELMEFLDSQLMQSEITKFQFMRLQRDCPLLYEAKIPLL